jgi:OmpA-OmpF porin, OOP family
MTQTQDWPRKSQYALWTWTIAILLALALLWLWFTGKGPDSANGCCGGAAVVAAPAATVLTPTPAASLRHTATWDGDKITLEGVVPDDAAKKALVAQAAAKYGATNVIDKLTIDAAAKGAITLALLGTAPSDAAKSARGDDAKAFYSGMPNVTIDNQLVVAQAPAPVVAAAPAAEAKDVTCGATVAVAATFATGSAQLTPQARTLLNAVVPCIAGPYEVGGHTDSVGNAAANVALSQRRAQSVAAYLASKGVDAKLMTAKGYGSAAPIGDNATEEGKATNRRIEFKKQ